MMNFCALDQTVVVVDENEVECCKLRYTDCLFGGIEVTVVESVVDSVVDVDVDIEEVGGVHSSWKEAKDVPVDDDDVRVEEVEDIHVGEEQCAFQVHLVDIVVDVEQDDGTGHDFLLHLLLLLFRQVHQYHNS